jgi:hypothetical protein
MNTRRRYFSIKPIILKSSKFWRKPNYRSRHSIPTFARIYSRNRSNSSRE